MAELTARLGVAGDVVELGCYAGDTSLELARALLEAGSQKRLWIYDSFEGLPAKTLLDNTNFKAGDLAVSKKSVRERFLKAHLPMPIIKKAWFSDLTSQDLPDQIALAFLDGDFYESIRDSLKLVAAHMSAGGIIIVHDYTNPNLPGAARAVDEFKKNACKIPAIRVL